MEEALIDPTLLKSMLETAPKNKGQNNRGIIVIDKYVVKCVSRSSLFSEETHLLANKNAELINEKLAGFYPKYYKWNDSNYNYLLNLSDVPDIADYVRCIIMEKLDGDLTSYILETSYKELKGDLTGYDEFYNRLPKTDCKYIIDMSESYDSLKKEIKPIIKRITIGLIDKMIELHHNILRRGYEYYDLKIDNIGYKLNDQILELYFIDAESGLSYIKPTSKFFDYINLHGFIRELYEYSILGQYNLSNIFDLKFTNNYQDLDLSEITKLITQHKFTVLPMGKKSDSRDYFRWIPFKIISTVEDYTYTDFYVIQVIFNKFRLIYFDENGYHMSNPNYNKTKIIIDDIFDTLIDIFSLIT